MRKVKRIIQGIAGFLLIAFTLGTSLADPASPKIRSISVQIDQGIVRVSINADKPVQVRSFQLAAPSPEIVFDIYPSVLWGKKETKAVGQAGVERIRVAQFSSDPDVTRVVADLSGTVGFKVEPSQDQKNLVIALGGNIQKTSNSVSPVVTTASAPESKVQGPSLPVPAKANQPAGLTPPSLPSELKAAPQTTGSPAVAQTKHEQRSPVWQNARMTEKVVSPDSNLESYTKISPELRPMLTSPSLQAKLSRIFIAKALSKKKKAMKKPAAAKAEAVSFSWKNADLTDVIRSLADRMGLNVIVDTSVKGSVTLDLRNVPAGQALGMILAINGYSSRQIGNILVVGPPDKLDKLPTTPIAVGPQAIQVIPLENAKPGDLRDTVAQEYPEVKVEADTRTNSLLVKGSVGAIRKVKQLVAELDKPVIVPPAVALQKEVIQLNYGDVKAIIAQVKPLLPSDAVLIADERMNAVIVIGSQYAIETVKSYVAAVDVPSPQVMLEMQVLSVNASANRDLGMEWPGSILTNVAETSASEPGGSLPAAGGSVVAPNSINLNNMGFHTFVRDNIGFQARLHFLVVQNKAKLLGAPRIATVNNKEANIQLGDRIPIVYFDPRAGLYQAQYIDVGVILRVTPSISPDGSITMHVSPQVSTVTGFVQNFPQLSTRQADTTLRVKNGETIVLGGLLRENNTDAVTKIPLLGDIPIIGEFFRHRTTVSQKDDLIISITPTLIASK